MRGRICAGFVLSVTVLSAQQVPPTTHADVARGLAAAERLLQEDKLEEANAQLRVLVDAAHRLGLDAEEAQAVCDLGQTLEHQSRYSEAEVTLRQCLEMAERTRNGLAIGRALFLLSRTADVAGRSAEAISLASRSIAAYDAIPNPAGAGAARIQLLHLQRPPLDETRAITARVV